MIDKTTIQRIMDATDIVEVVREFVDIRKAGTYYKGLCPFHKEKTPPFTVNEAKGFYHCFGCGAHGDIIKFEMEANNLPFMDALEKLANKAGLPMPKFSKEHSAEQEKRQSLYDIMELAAGFYERTLYLREGAQGLEYFRRRGLDDELIKKFRLGYAPANNALKAYFGKRRGFFIVKRAQASIFASFAGELYFFSNHIGNRYAASQFINKFL